MHNPFPKKKSKLPPTGKAIAAAMALLAVRDGKMEAKEAGQFLRARVGLQWTVLTAAQYLTGKEAMQALDSLPPEWSTEGYTRKQMVEAVLFANLFCAQAHPSGSSLSAGSLVAEFKPDGEVGKLLRELGVIPDGFGPSGKAH